MQYTYLIGWSKLDRWYFGLRYKKNCSLNDLWKTYFTSSKYVRKFRIENGEPDIIQIRTIFQDADKARQWEHKILRRMKVIKKEKWLNRTDNRAIFLDSDTRKMVSEKCSKTLKGRRSNTTKESSAKGAKTRIGMFWWNDGVIEIKSKLCPEGFQRGRIWKPSEEQKLKNSKLHKGNKHNVGRHHSEEHKKLVSEKSSK